MHERVTVLGKVEDRPLKKTQICGSCGGTGCIPMSCSRCNGLKFIARYKGPAIECSFCNGTGKKPSAKKCKGCRGRGTINGPLKY